MSPPSRPDPADHETRWIRTDDALVRRVADGVVVVRLPDGEPELVAGSGGVLWDLLATARSLPELTAEIAGRYEHDPEIVGRDLGLALEALRQRHLVVIDG